MSDENIPNTLAGTEDKGNAEEPGGLENPSPTVYWKWPWHLALAFSLAALVAASFLEISWTHEDPPESYHMKTGCYINQQRICGRIHMILRASPNAERPTSVDDPRVMEEFRGGGRPVCPHSTGKYSFEYRPDGIVLICTAHGEFSPYPYPGQVQEEKVPELEDPYDPEPLSPSR